MVDPGQPFFIEAVTFNYPYFVAEICCSMLTAVSLKNLTVLWVYLK
jgi:hypothetical protein